MIVLRGWWGRKSKVGRAKGEALGHHRRRRAQFSDPTQRHSLVGERGEFWHIVRCQLANAGPRKTPLSLFLSLASLLMLLLFLPPAYIPPFFCFRLFLSPPPSLSICLYFFGAFFPPRLLPLFSLPLILFFSIFVVISPSPTFLCFFPLRPNDSLVFPSLSVPLSPSFVRLLSSPVTRVLRTAARFIKPPKYSNAPVARCFREFSPPGP